MTGPNADPAERAEGGDAAAERENDARVDEAAEESFPASDPPSWEPLHSGGPKRAAPGRRDDAAGGGDGGGRSDDDQGDVPAGMSGAAAFGAHLAGLEERVAAADARGESVPAEARAMIAHLREIVEALDGLTATLGGEGGGRSAASGAEAAASSVEPPPPPAGQAPA